MRIHFAGVMISVSVAANSLSDVTWRFAQVEALLQTYRRRRLSRASNLPCGDTPTPNDPTR